MGRIEHTLLEGEIPSPPLSVRYLALEAWDQVARNRPKTTARNHKAFSSPVIPIPYHTKATNVSNLWLVGLAANASTLTYRTRSGGLLRIAQNLFLDIEHHTGAVARAARSNNSRLVFGVLEGMMRSLR